MGMFINTNTKALNTQRRLMKTGRLLDKSFQRLSSGLRINSAADDAAGLSIATRMQSQIRGINQAVRNTNDGISLAQTVEGALDESTNILQRMRELSIQAANDTNTLADREAMQAEVFHLKEELDRIAKTTRFNDTRVLDGSFAGSKFHIGYKANETVEVRAMDARVSILGRQARYDGQLVNSQALNNGDVIINNTTIRGTVPSDDVLSTSNSAGSAIAKAAAINDATQYTGVRAIVNKTAVSGNNSIGGVTLNSENYIVINDEMITGFEVRDNDASGSLLDAINAISNKTGVSARLDEKLNLVLEAEDGRNIDVEVAGLASSLNLDMTGGVATANGNRLVQGGSITLQSTEAITIEHPDQAVALAKLGHGDNAGGPTILGVNSNYSVETIDITSRLGANQAMDILDVALNQVSMIRSDLGAIQNRMMNTVNNLAATSENVSAARARIQDADIAAESAQLSRVQILQQAGTSILAQANQAPQQIMQLLG